MITSTSPSSRSGSRVGSGLASWLASGRIVLLPTPVGGAPHGRSSALDLAYAVYRRRAARRRRSARGRSSPDGRRLAHRDRLRRPRDRRRPVHRAVLRRGPGLGRRGRRARVIAAVNVLSAAFMVAGALVAAGLQTAGVDAADASSRLLGVANLVAGRDHLPDAADEPVPRLPLDPLPRLLPARGEGARERRQGRPERDRRAQPCRASSTRRWRCRCSTRSRSSPSTTASPSAGGCGRS